MSSSKPEEELETDLDKLIFLMKHTDTATINDPIPKVVSNTEWMQHLLKTLELKNLTDDERDAYEKDAINTALVIAIEEHDEKERQKTNQMKREVARMAEENRQEAQRLVQEAEKNEREAKNKQEAKKLVEKAKKNEQKAKELEKAAKEAEQLAKEPDHRINILIEEMLIISTDNDAGIAELLNVSIERVQDIKQQLKDK